ncbi:energy transducer TonB [Alishewanella longhuensis]
MATPLVRAEPRFPTEAARQGISGWVMLNFSIDESGSVTDVSVVAAEPKDIFEREAIRALRRWKYQPQLVEGKAVKQSNLQVQLDFQLQQE